MDLVIRPLTPDQWPALEDLFGEHGAVNGCWCMYWRIGSAYRKRQREANKAAFRDLVKHGPPPGLLAFEGDVAVSWCQLTPRDAQNAYSWGPPGSQTPGRGRYAPPDPLNGRSWTWQNP